MIGEIEEETSSVFSKYGGLLGLSFPEIASEGVELVFDNMIKRNILEKNLFSFIFYPDGQRSDVQFGAINETAYTGDIVWHKVTKRAHWTIGL